MSVYTTLQRYIVGAAIVFGAVSLPPAATVAAAAPKIALGTLMCSSVSNSGFIIGSKERLNCTFSTILDGHFHYIAWITKVGIDVGFKGNSKLVWTVLGTSTDVPSTALEGTYGGLTAGLALGIGANANVLVGGLGQSIMLQPLSVEGQIGLNISAGVAGLTLQGG